MVLFCCFLIYKDILTKIIIKDEKSPHFLLKHPFYGKTLTCHPPKAHIPPTNSDEVYKEIFKSTHNTCFSLTFYHIQICSIDWYKHCHVVRILHSFDQDFFGELHCQKSYCKSFQPFFSKLVSNFFSISAWGFPRMMIMNCKRDGFDWIALKVIANVRKVRFGSFLHISLY